ncbi:hypothetical protein IscW_ISCW007488 [Ixodes scapularis]|uniref:Uncharacterized protein n=1 Tax=Ixodes scapularis TaxID=6945 RepID=B7PWQ4_IXOSC|nr:hypothetical protein IscW_ISCW007488 [Ixodes scapularis]|eukprot:XP_002410181.1 hypothetical protein IscW_ISCW007488 [Ixodes scapularis]
MPRVAEWSKAYKTFVRLENTIVGSWQREGLKCFFGSEPLPCPILVPIFLPETLSIYVQSRNAASIFCSNIQIYYKHSNIRKVKTALHITKKKQKNLMPTAVLHSKHILWQTLLAVTDE